MLLTLLLDGLTLHPKRGMTSYSSKDRLFLLQNTPNFFFLQQLHLFLHLQILLTCLLAIDNSVLLERFKTTFQENTEWHEALVAGNSDFVVQDNMVFHKGHLFVLSSLCADILHTHHDSSIAGHPGHT